MIVISDDVVLTGIEAELGADLPLIGWHNIVTRDSLSADTEDPLFPAVNLANPATHLKWKAGDGDEQYITVTISGVDPIDYLAIANHNFGSEGITVSVEGSESLLDSPPWLELNEEMIPPNDDPLLFRFPPQSLEAIRLKIQPGSSPAPIAEAAVIYVGQLLVVERGLAVDEEFTPISLGKKTNAIVGVSESGNFLGRVVLAQRAEATAFFRWLTPDWYRDTFNPFVVASKDQPFFFVWAPLTYPLEVGYCWTAQDPTPITDPVTRRMHVSLSMIGIA